MIFGYLEPIKDIWVTKPQDATGQNEQFQVGPQLQGPETDVRSFFS